MSPPKGGPYAGTDTALPAGIQAGGRQALPLLEQVTGCTYSARKPGDLPRLERRRHPFGRVHLAGEHTETVSGYVESALRSGRRVARRILGLPS